MLSREDLQAISTLLDQKLEPMQQRMDGMQKDIADLKEDVAQLREESAITRRAGLNSSCAGQMTRMRRPAA